MAYRLLFILATITVGTCEQPYSKNMGEPLTVKDVDYPEPGADQVIVETEACGICRSDWHAWQGD